MLNKTVLNESMLSESILKAQKERLALLMDGQCCESAFIDTVAKSKTLQQRWLRYHITRDVMQGKVLHDCALSFDIAEKVADAIALSEQPLAAHSLPAQTQLPNVINLFKAKIVKIFVKNAVKDIALKVSQVGLAACVTLGIIAGVQYQQSGTDSHELPILSTVPVGIDIAPVGGIHHLKQDNIKHIAQDSIESEQYDKIRLLVQDYELQRRLNAQ